jgi:hypothetical protein
VPLRSPISETLAYPSAVPPVPSTAYPTAGRTGLASKFPLARKPIGFLVPLGDLILSEERLRLSHRPLDEVSWVSEPGATSLFF